MFFSCFLPAYAPRTPLVSLIYTAHAPHTPHTRIPDIVMILCGICERHPGHAMGVRGSYQGGVRVSRFRYFSCMFCVFFACFLGFAYAYPHTRPSHPSHTPPHTPPRTHLKHTYQPPFGVCAEVVSGAGVCGGVYAEDDIYNFSLCFLFFCVFLCFFSCVYLCRPPTHAPRTPHTPLTAHTHACQPPLRASTGFAMGVWGLRWVCGTC